MFILQQWPELGKLKMPKAQLFSSLVEFICLVLYIFVAPSASLPMTKVWWTNLFSYCKPSAGLILPLGQPLESPINKRACCQNLFLHAGSDVNLTRSKHQAAHGRSRIYNIWRSQILTSIFTIFSEGTLSYPCPKCWNWDSCQKIFIDNQATNKKVLQTSIDVKIREH